MRSIRISGMPLAIVGIKGLILIRETVQRSEDGCDMIKFRIFNHSTCKTVLNLLGAIYLRLRKIVVDRVTVVKFGVDNRGSNGTGCFRIKVRTDTAELTNMRIAGLRK